MQRDAGAEYSDDIVDRGLKRQAGFSESDAATKRLRDIADSNAALDYIAFRDEADVGDGGGERDAYPQADILIRPRLTPEEIARRRGGHMEYFRQAHQQQYGRLMALLTAEESASLRVEFGRADYQFETYPPQQPGWVTISFVRDGERRTVAQGCMWAENVDFGTRWLAEQRGGSLRTAEAATRRPRPSGAAPDRETAYRWALDLAIDRIEHEQFDPDASLSDIPPEPPDVPPTPEERRQEVLARYPGMQEELIAALPGRNEQERREIYETVEVSVGPVADYGRERLMVARVLRPGEIITETYEARMTFRRGPWLYTTVTQYTHLSEWQEPTAIPLLAEAQPSRGGESRRKRRDELRRKRRLERIEEFNRDGEEEALRLTIDAIAEGDYTLPPERVGRGRDRNRPGGRPVPVPWMRRRDPRMEEEESTGKARAQDLPATAERRRQVESVQKIERAPQPGPQSLNQLAEELLKNARLPRSREKVIRAFLESYDIGEGTNWGPLLEQLRQKQNAPLRDALAKMLHGLLRRPGLSTVIECRAFWLYLAVRSTQMNLDNPRREDLRELSSTLLHHLERPLREPHLSAADLQGLRRTLDALEVLELFVEQPEIMKGFMQGLQKLITSLGVRVDRPLNARERLLLEWQDEMSELQKNIREFSRRNPSRDVAPEPPPTPAVP